MYIDNLLHRNSHIQLTLVIRTLVNYVPLDRMMHIPSGFQSYF